jgi:hypothetical protein
MSAQSALKWAALCGNIAVIDKITAERDAWKALAKARLAYMIASADSNLVACYAANDAAEEAMKTLRALGVPESELQ